MPQVQPLVWNAVVREWVCAPGARKFNNTGGMDVCSLPPTMQGVGAKCFDFEGIAQGSASASG